MNLAHIYRPAKPRVTHDKKAGNVVSFPIAMELTLDDVCKYCFGPDSSSGYPQSFCQTAVCYKDAYRKKANFMSADCLIFDLDGEGHEGCEPEAWRAIHKPLLEKTGFHVIAYPSHTFKLHFFLFLSHSVTTVQDYETVIKYVFHSLQAVDPVFKRDLDAKDLDGAHMLYEGAWKLDDPREWAFELPGATVDVDNALNAMRAPSEGKTPGYVNSRPLRELDRLIHTEGSRNDSCYDYALYCIANSRTWEEAESKYYFKCSDNGLDKEELDSVFESAKKADTVTLGCDLKADKKSANAPQEDVAIAYEALEGEVRRLCRRAVQNAVETCVQPDRLKSNEIYALHEFEPGSNKGYASLITPESYERLVLNLINDYTSGNPLLKMKLKANQNRQLGPQILSNDGLEIPSQDRAFFHNGIFETYGGGGVANVDYAFKPIEDNCYLISPCSWDYVSALDPGFIDCLNFYYPRAGYEKTLISPEAMIVGDHLGSTFSRRSHDDQMLVVYGPGGNGKSNFWDTNINGAAGGAPAFKLLPDSLLVGNENPFDWLETQDVLLGYYDDLPVDALIDCARAKRLFESGSVQMDRKYGAKWVEKKLFKVTMATNTLPTFTSMDAGLQRRLRCVYVKQSLYKSGMPIRKWKPDVIQSGICAFMRMPWIPRCLYEDYPLMGIWMSNISEKGLWSELLKPADRRGKAELTTIRMYLRGAGSPLAKLSDKKLADKIEQAGFPVMRSNNNTRHVRGYVINMDSAIVRAAKRDYDNLSDGPEDEADNYDFSQARREYIKAHDDELMEYSSRLEAMLPASSRSHRVYSVPVMPRLS